MKRILVVEDDRFTIDIIDRVLTKKGYHVTKAMNRKQAIHKIDTEAIDLLITDIMLPYTGGFEIIDYMKICPGFVNIPIIMMTSMDQEILEATEVHADACLIKPIKPKELLTAIEELIVQ